MTDRASRPMAVEIPIRPRGYDTDFAGVVNNIVYVRWLEDLRHTILDQHLPLKQQMERGFCPMLIATRIEYKRALDVHDRPIGKMWMKDLGKLRWTVEAEILVDGDIAATAEQVGIFIGLEDHRPIRMPQDLIDKFQKMTKTPD